MITKLRYSLLLIAFTLMTATLFGQEYVDAEFYLIDTLSFKDVDAADKRFVDSCLLVYHKEQSDTTKINILNSIVDDLWDDKLWGPYNLLVLEKCDAALKNGGLKQDEKKFYSHAHLNALNNKGYFYQHRGDLNNGVFYYFEALKVARRNSDSVSMAVVLNNIGHIEQEMGNSLDAAKYYKRSLKIKKDLKDFPGAATTLNNLGVLYRDVGNVEEALRNYFESIDILERIGDYRKVAVIKSNIGIIYLDQSDTLRAIEFFNQSIAVSNTIEDRLGGALTHSSMANIYISQRDSANALIHLQISLNDFRSLHEKHGEGSCYGQYGQLYESFEDYRKALDYYSKSFDLFKAISHKKGMASQLFRIGTLLFKQGKKGEALSKAKESYVYAQETGYPKEIADAAQLLQTIYADQGNWKDAYHYQEVCKNMQDSVRNIEVLRNSKNQSYKYELKQNQRMFDLLKTKNELLLKNRRIDQLQIAESETYLWLVSIGVTGLIIALFFTLREWKRQKKLSRLLTDQKEILQARDKEKETMLKEIHHRVKNNLQMVVSLLRIQAREVEEENVKAMFEEAQNRIVSMSLIHEKMYGTDDLKNIDTQEYFETLISNVVNSYEQESKIKVVVSVRDVMIGINTFLPLGLIINEIVSNSMKYAFKSTSEGEITMEMERIGEERFKIIVADDGEGFDAENVKPGLGTELIETFIEQLNGEYTISTEKGTCYELIVENID